MSVAEAILERLKKMPEDKQRQVLEYADSLASHQPTSPLRSIEGLWSSFDVRPVTEFDITEARREMWRDFPSDPAE